MFIKIFYVLLLTVNAIFECYSFFKALGTVCYDIDQESNHVLPKELVLMLLTHMCILIFLRVTLILERNTQLCFMEPSCENVD